MQYQSLQEPTLLKHCHILASEVSTHAVAGTSFNLDHLMESCMFDLATDLMIGFNPDTLHDAQSSLYKDWALINDAAMIRSLTKSFPYWRYPLTQTSYQKRVDLARDSIDERVRGYVTRSHSYCMANPEKSPTSAMEYYFLTPKDPSCELSDEEVVHHALNLVWGIVNPFDASFLFHFSHSNSCRCCRLNQICHDHVSGDCVASPVGGSQVVGGA